MWGCPEGWEGILGTKEVSVLQLENPKEGAGTAEAESGGEFGKRLDPVEG